MAHPAPQPHTQPDYQPDCPSIDALRREIMDGVYPTVGQNAPEAADPDRRREAMREMVRNAYVEFFSVPGDPRPNRFGLEAFDHDLGSDRRRFGEPTIDAGVLRHIRERAHQRTQYHAVLAHAALHAPATVRVARAGRGSAQPRPQEHAPLPPQQQEEDSTPGQNNTQLLLPSDDFTRALRAPADADPRAPRHGLRPFKRRQPGTGERPTLPLPVVSREAADAQPAATSTRPQRSRQTRVLVGGVPGLGSRVRRHVGLFIAGERQLINWRGINIHNPLQGFDVHEAAHAINHHVRRGIAIVRANYEEARQALDAARPELGRYNPGNFVRLARNAWDRSSVRRSRIGEQYDVRDALYQGMLRAASRDHMRHTMMLERAMADEQHDTDLAYAPIVDDVLNRLRKNQGYANTLRVAQGYFPINGLVFSAISQLANQGWDLRGTDALANASEAERDQFANLVGEALADATHKAARVNGRVQRANVRYERRLRRRAS